MYEYTLSLTTECVSIYIYSYSTNTVRFLNILRPGQNGCNFADDSFKCIFLNENVYISIRISLKFVPKGPINNMSALIKIKAWRRPGDKPLSEPMIVRLPTVFQWVSYSTKYLSIRDKTGYNRNWDRSRSVGSISGWTVSISKWRTMRPIKLAFVVRWYKIEKSLLTNGVIIYSIKMPNHNINKSWLINKYPT